MDRTIQLKVHDLDGVARVQVPDAFERVPGVADNQAGVVHPFLPDVVPLDRHTDREKLTFYFTAGTYHDPGGNRHVGELLAITLYRDPVCLEGRLQDHLAYVLDHAMKLDVRWPEVATRDRRVFDAQGIGSRSLSDADLAWQDPLEGPGQRIDSAAGRYPYVGFFTAAAHRAARLYVLTDTAGHFRLAYTSQKRHRPRDVALDWLRQVAASLEIAPRLMAHFEG